MTYNQDGGWVFLLIVCSHMFVFILGMWVQGRRPK
jgi:hypothetical protein